MQERNYTSIYIPCKPYILKWATIKYGPKICIDTISELGLFLTVCMSAKTVPHKEARAMRAIARQQTHLTVHLPAGSVPRTDAGMSSYYARLFGQFLEVKFKEDVVNFCAIQTAAGQRYRGHEKALFAFAAAYDLEIEIDITYENLKKLEQRQRNRRQAVLSRK